MYPYNQQMPHAQQNMQYPQQPPQNQGVPFESVIQQNYVQQLPPAPHTDAVAYLDPGTIGAIHHGLVNTLQQKSNANPARTVLFNYYSQGGFNNPQYAELLSMACEYFHVFRTTKGVTPEQAAEEVVILHLPTALDLNPQIQHVLGHQGMEELRKIGYRRIAVHNEIQQLTNQGGQPQHPQGYPGYQNHAQPNNMMYPNQQGPMQMGNPRHMGQGNSGYPTGGYSGHQAGHHGVQQGGYRGGMPQQPSRPSIGSGYSGVTTMNANSMVRGGGMGHDTPTMSSVGPSRFNGSGGVKQNNKPVDPPPSIKTSIDTTRSQPGKVSQGEKDMNVVDSVTRNIGHQLAMGEVAEIHEENTKDVLYQATRYKPLLTRYQDLVETQTGYNVIDKGNNSMDYRDHETNPEMIRLSRSHKVGPTIVPDARWPQVTVASVMDKTTTKEDVEKLSADDSIIIKEPIGAHTLMNARFKAIDQLRERGVENIDKRVVESYPLIATTVECSESDEKILNDLMGEVDLTSFVDALADYAQELTPIIYYHIADTVTAIFNRRLKCGIGRNTRIDTILEDYEPAINLLAKSLETTAIDRFKKNTLAAIKLALNYHFDKEKGSVQFLEANSLTVLPWSSSSIQLYMNGEYGMLSENTSEEFHAACLKLLDRTSRGREAVSRRFIVTADNVWLELHQGDMGKKTLIISKPNDIR